MSRRPSLHLLLLAASANLAISQAPKQQRPLQPLGDVLHLVLDQDKDQKVTMPEVNSQMSMLENLFAGSEGEEGAEYRQLLKGVKAAAPTMFALLDSNSDKSLTKAELKYVTKFETSIKNGGGMRDLLRDVFSLLDADGDDQLSADELYTASQSSGTISDVTKRFHELFPVRKTPGELEDFVRETIESFGGGGGSADNNNGALDSIDREKVVESMKWIDDDGDGYIQRKEVGKYYNIAGKKFLEISKTIKQMGPMLAMFGGMDMKGGGGGGGGGFKMDL